MALLAKDGDVIDKEWGDFTAEMYAEGHSFFTYMSDNADSLSSCCRLRNEIQDNGFSYTLGAGGVSTGSKSVLTINLNRCIQYAVNHKIDYAEYLSEVIDLCHKVQLAYNENLKELQKHGMLPLFDAGYINMGRQYLTIGVNGLVEAAEFMGLTITDNPDYLHFVQKVLGLVEKYNKQYRTKDVLFNCEMIPAENVGVKHLLNIKTVAERRQNMLWFRAPQKVYIKKGCLPVALDELKNVMNKKRAFIVTDSFLYQNGYTKAITDKLDDMGIQHTTFFDVAPDPTLACAKEGTKQMTAFQPDCIIALGGGSAMDAAKIMWVMYEHPEVDFMDMAMRFIDIRKRVYTFPKMGEKAYFIAIPTSAGTGSEVTPFAVITDEQTGVKYPLADYELLPNMAIIDTDFHMSAPKGLTSASGIDAVTHALEAYASVMATDYTDGLALKALKTIFEYLPRAYENGQTDVEAREKMANAATMAGMAFANAFLGVCHSMAHKLGAFHHLPHGVANALMIEEVLRFNASEVPAKMGTFSQYDHPHTLARYAEVADYLGLGGKNDEEKLENLIKAINELKEKIGIKKTIKDYGIDEKDFLDRLDEMTEQAFDDQCTGANPRYPLMSEIKQMYLDAYYGKHFVEKKVPHAQESISDDEHNFKKTYSKSKKSAK